MTITQPSLWRSAGQLRKARAWYTSRRADNAVRRTDAWEHETFAEEQARWERADPEYARICESVRRAREIGGEASLRADGVKAAWDARVATQRQTTDDVETAYHDTLVASHRRARPPAA
jgi:hypothetical protein